MLTLLLCGCSKHEETSAPSNGEVCCAVRFPGDGSGIDALQDITTKSYVAENGVSVFLENDDELYLWAETISGASIFSAKKFTIYGKKDSYAFFTGDLGFPMSDGKYVYLACSPVPSSCDGYQVSYQVPAVQDGRGEGVMIADPVRGGRLMSLNEYDENRAVSLEMNQMLHLLQLYIVDNQNLLKGETIKRLRLAFSAGVTGTAVADLEHPESGLSSTYDSKVLTLEMTEPLVVSTSGERHYAYATILPRNWGKSDNVSIRMYSDTKMADANVISMKGRSMAEGHATPVKVQPSAVHPYYRITFTLNTNPIGEDIESITLTAPQGCKWGSTGTNVYVYDPEGDIAVGDEFTIEYEDESVFRAMGGKDVTVTYDSEHVRLTQSMVMDNLASKVAANMSLNVPDLLKENFDKVGTFSSNDEYTAGSNSGSKSAYSFLNGWTGGRIGASAGQCIRLACRRETSADYDSRVDSAPLNCVFKKETNLKVSFGYGSNNKYGGIPIIVDGNVGQTCYVGYVTSNTGYKSGDDDGTFESGNSFYTKEYTGSWSNVPNEDEYVIHGIAAGTSPVRITWRTEVEHQAGTTNTTAWLYLDNIKVTISK